MRKSRTQLASKIGVYRYVWLASLLLLPLAFPAVGVACAQAPSDQLGPEVSSSEDLAAVEVPAKSRTGYVVEVPLPLIGDRDEKVRQQIERIASSASNGAQRPTVVLRFQSATIGAVGEPDNGEMGTRGSQFERCLALARFLTSPEASRVRLIAYVAETVTGHAVLPVLACEEVFAIRGVELGQAAIDEPLDATIAGAYKDVVARRATLPEPVVMAMLDPTAEVYSLDLADGTSLIADRPTSDKLRDDGKVNREETVWPGGGLASFPAAQLRARRWIARTVTDSTELTEALGINGVLRTTQQLPREWKGVSITVSGVLNAGRVNQIIRAVNDAVDNDGVNLILLKVEEASTSFTDASRLAAFFAGLGEDVYTVGMISQSLTGPISLPAVACDEAVLLGGFTIGPPENQAENVADGNTAQRVLDELANSANRPLPLLAALCDPMVEVTEFIHQGNGRKAIFTEWQMENQEDAQLWLAREKVAGGEAIENDIAVRYRLLDAVNATIPDTLNRLGLEAVPEELATPWLDASIQMLLAQPWLPRILLTIGFFALMAELGSPGLGIGGLLSAVCFLGFFWIEGLNGNVEWLEILLFIAGVVALAMEIFVVPGFGVFGISGLLMVFVSIVLASQTFIWPTTSAQLDEVAVNLFWVACLALCGMVGLVFMHKQLERSPLLRWVTLQPGGSEFLDEVDIRESFLHLDHLLGQQGLTTTRLNPSGKAQFGREIVTVIGSGEMISEGVPVRVVEVRGSLVIVESAA